MRASVLETLAGITKESWNTLTDGSSPFMRHEFLLALENSGCVGRSTGWHPWFITLHDEQGLAAAAPSWLKSNSYGEFVFDFAWAQAYSRSGLNYYPKLTSAAPFTPASGPRLLVRQDLSHAQIAPKLLQAISAAANERDLSSAHILFPDSRDLATIAEDDNWLIRRDCQFHWTNRGYQNFEDFLGSFTADKRKKAKRERRRVTESGIVFETRLGSEITAKELDAAWHLHRINFIRHGNEPYLNLNFFYELTRTLGNSLMFKLARHGDQFVAVAIFFISRHTLYGRYWGATDDFHSLHFETCYHQGIEYCIEHGLQRFEPGTQGEHKVSRGFEPEFTYSAHYIREPQFKTAIAAYLSREGRGVEEYAAGIREHVPYRESL